MSKDDPIIKYDLIMLFPRDTSPGVFLTVLAPHPISPYQDGSLPIVVTFKGRTYAQIATGNRRYFETVDIFIHDHEQVAIPLSALADAGLETVDSLEGTRLYRRIPVNHPSYRCGAWCDYPDGDGWKSATHTLGTPSSLPDAQQAAVEPTLGDKILPITHPPIGWEDFTPTEQFEWNKRMSDTTMKGKQIPDFPDFTRALREGRDPLAPPSADDDLAGLPIDLKGTMPEDVLDPHVDAPEAPGDGDCYWCARGYSRVRSSINPDTVVYVHPSTPMGRRVCPPAPFTPEAHGTVFDERLIPDPSLFLPNSNAFLNLVPLEDWMGFTPTKPEPTVDVRLFKNQKMGHDFIKTVTIPCTSLDRRDLSEMVIYEGRYFTRGVSNLDCYSEVTFTHASDPTDPAPTPTSTMTQPEWTALIIAELTAAGFTVSDHQGLPLVAVPNTLEGKVGLLKFKLSVPCVKNLYEEGVLITPCQ